MKIQYAYKCKSPECAHCSENPIQSLGLFQSLTNTDGRLATPQLSKVHNGHYNTMLETYGHGVPNQKLEVDQGLPSLAGKRTDEYRCPRECTFVLRSQAALTRHEILFHLEERRKDQREKRKESHGASNVPTKSFICKYKLDNNGGAECGYEATSLYFLRKHKAEKGHIKHLILTLMLDKETVQGC